MNPLIVEFIKTFDIENILFITSGSDEATSLKLRAIYGNLSGISFIFGVDKADPKFWENFV